VREARRVSVDGPKRAFPVTLSVYIGAQGIRFLVVGSDYIT